MAKACVSRGKEPGLFILGTADMQAGPCTSSGLCHVSPVCCAVTHNTNIVGALAKTLDLALLFFLATPLSLVIFDP